MSSIYYREKLTISQLVGKINFSERKFEEMHYIRGNFYFGIIVLSCFFSTKSFLRLFFFLLSQEIKGFYQNFLENKVDFRDIMNVSPNILVEN